MEEDAVRRLRHDLRSPLMVISGFARLLGGDRPLNDDERQEFAGRIEEACEEMKRTIDEFGAA